MKGIKSNIMDFTFKISYSTILLFLISYGLTGQTKTTYQNNQLSLDSLVHYGKLDNGFTYYIRKNHTEKNQVEMYLVTKAGMFHEENDQLGYAHLMEHLVFKETTHFPKVKEYFRKVGRKAHAGTRYTYTYYNVGLATDDTIALANGLQLLRDWAQDLEFDQNSLKTEQGAVLGEMRVNNPYREWKSDKIKSLITEGTGYKEQDLDKIKQSTKNLHKQAFIRFHNDWYQPELEAAIIVGDIDPEKIESRIKNLFSNLKPSKKTKNPQDWVRRQKARLSGKNRFATTIDTISPGLQLAILFNQPNFSDQITSKEDYQLMIQQEFYWRLVQAKQEALKNQYALPYSDLSVNYLRNRIAAGQIASSKMMIDFEQGDQNTIEEKIKSSLLFWKRFNTGFSENEFQKVKAQLLNKYTNRSDRSSQELIMKYLNHFVNGTLAPNSVIESQLLSQMIKKTSLEDIQKFVSTYAKFTENTDFLFFRHPKAQKPNFNVLKHLISTIDTMSIPILPPAPATINSLSKFYPLDSISSDKEVQVKKDILGVSRMTLNNGLHLILKPTNPTSAAFKDQINITAFKINEASPLQRKNYLSNMAFIDMLNFSGAGPYSRFQLEKFKDSKGISLHYRADKDWQLISAKSNSKNFSELLSLVVLQNTQPNFVDSDIQLWKSSTAKNLKGFGIRGSTYFIDQAIETKWFPDIPKMQLKDLAVIDKSTLMEAANTWTKNLTDFTFIVTGDFEVDTIIPILNQKLSVIPASTINQNKERKGAAFPFKKMKETLYEKNINQAYVKLYFPVKIKNTTKNKALINIISQALYERIYDRLREGCYAPLGGGQWLDEENNLYAFKIQFDSELGNETKMIKDALEEFQKLKQQGINKQWLELEIKTELNRYEKYFDRFGYVDFWSEYLMLSTKDKKQYFNNILRYGTLMEHFINIEDVNTAAKKYLTQENYQQFIILPEAYHQMN